MPNIQVAFKPGTTLVCTKEISFGSEVIPSGTLGIVETVSVDRKEGKHYTVYFDMVLMDGYRKEEDVPYILTKERIEDLGLEVLIQAL